ncbi:hypothetical protein [Nocardia sp. NPDC050710]|uniref:hypothetical protein n=1 Tax=Nocardia sp. NPDC050710 TaxID=3157220 RepID=UPI0033D22EFD
MGVTKEFGTRVSLAFEMWERTHGRPLADETVAGWLTALGHGISADYVRAMRTGQVAEAPDSVRAGLAQVFGLDPGYFGYTPVLTYSHDQEVLDDLDNVALRRLGRVAQGLSMRTLLYLESVADTLRRADGLPPVNWTAQI